MGNIRSFALLLGFIASAATSAAPALGQGAPNPAARTLPAGKVPTAPSDNDVASPAERLQKRRERLQQGAQRLRDRAAELRKKAANGDPLPPNPAGSTHPTRSFEEQAQKLEEQANKMDERAKSLTEADMSTEPSRPGNAKERRHQIRRATINRRWGPALHNPEAIAELKVHAERAAKLRRIRALASEKNKDDPTVKRAAELIAKEEARHERRMKAFLDQAGGAAAQPSTTPATTAPAAAPAEEQGK